MLYKNLGTTKIKVSQLCLGTMNFGDQNSEAEGHEQLNFALENKINFIDTAELYPVPPKAETYSRTETIIGNWFKKSGNRLKVVLATKCSGPAPNLDWIREGKTQFDLQTLEKACDASLTRLQTDNIDLYQLHWPTRRTNFFGIANYKHLTPDIYPLENTIEALNTLIKKGKIKHWGLSNESAWGALSFIHTAQKMGLEGPVSIQNPYNLLNRYYEVGLAEISLREQCGLLAYSPMGFGSLSGKYLNGKKPEGSRLHRWSNHFSRYSCNEATSATAKYCKLAAKWNISPAQLALAFVNSQDFLTSNIIGASSIEQLKENIESIQIKLSKEQIDAIEEIHQQQPNPAP